jgi:hypothetical protein
MGFSQPVGIAIAQDGTIWVANAAFNSPGNGVAFDKLLLSA